ncbi:MAG: hypothetical protein GWP10_17330, partial [Nitrospiraceae bacterium]|nr:hypothetical protein [Nitrospiraceae bacterium]
MKIYRWLISLMLVALLASSIAVFAQEKPTCRITVNPSESIQTAINEAPVGAVICLASGTWTENIKVEKSLTLKGTGADKATIIGKEEGPVVWIAAPAGATQTVSVKIEGLKITGAHGWCLGNVCACGMLIQSSAQVMLSDSSISENKRDGINLTGSAQATISNSIISGNGIDGIKLEDLAQVTISGSTISKNKVFGIDLGDSTRATISNSTISENMATGVYVGGLFQAVISKVQISISNSTISRNNGGIGLAGSARGTISDCTISRNEGAGIGLMGSAQATISESTVSENSFGITLWESPKATISDCNIFENKHDGVNVSGSAQAKIFDSRISGNKEYGVGLG